MLKELLGISLIGLGLLIWDQAKGPIFPDELYCAIGAGTQQLISGSSRPMVGPAPLALPTV